MPSLAAGRPLGRSRESWFVLRRSPKDCGLDRTAIARQRAKCDRFGGEVAPQTESRRQWAVKRPKTKRELGVRKNHNQDQAAGGVGREEKRGTRAIDVGRGVGVGYRTRCAGTYLLACDFGTCQRHLCNSLRQNFPCFRLLNVWESCKLRPSCKMRKPIATNNDLEGPDSDAPARTTAVSFAERPQDGKGVLIMG
jgi:hypothetical protein